MEETGNTDAGSPKTKKKGPSVYGRWVRATREERGLSLSALANLSQVHRLHLHAIESGRVQCPYEETQLKICKALGKMPPDDVRATMPDRARMCPVPGLLKRELSPYAQWLRAARRGSGISQYKLAELSGVDRTIIAFTESGRTQLPCMKNRIRISEVLGQRPTDAVLEQTRKRRSSNPRCSFCGELDRDCEYLFASALHRRARICSACLEKMTAEVAVEERKRRLTRPTGVSGGARSPSGPPKSPPD